MKPDADPAKVLAELKRSPKYAHLSPETLRRFANRAVLFHKRPADAVAFAKRKLHQAFGAFQTDAGLKKARKIFESLPLNPDQDVLTSSCREIMACHASTEERLPDLDRLAKWIKERIGEPKSVADLACGLFPFAWPWYGFPQTTKLTAWDIDSRMTELISEFFGRAGIRGAAECRDLLASPPPDAEVVFLFKTLTTIDRQESGAGKRLVESIHAPIIVASFPTTSLGGKEKGMKEKYLAEWQPVLELNGRTTELLDLSNELVILARK